MKYSLDTRRTVWNDTTGECIEIGPDEDGLDVLLITQKEGTTVYGQVRIYSRSQYELLLNALTKCAEEILK